MKIVDIRTVVVGNPWKNWIFVIVETSNGLIGLGEATGGLSTKPNESAVNEIKHLVIGKDPRNINKIIDEIFKSSFLKITPALSAIEIACWDILGKYLSVPIYQLFGGKIRNKVRVYANGWYPSSRDPDLIAQKAKEVVSKGYTALKLDPFGTAYMKLDYKEEEETKNILKSIRKTVGDKVELMIEGHKRFSIREAIRIGNWLEDISPTWFEDPVENSDVDSLVSVAQRVPVRIVAGEGFNLARDFSKFIEKRVTDIVNPEVLRIGGILGAVQVASIGKANDVDMAFHNAESPLKTMINLQLCGFISNIYIQECFDEFLEPWVSDILLDFQKVSKGFLEIPDKPGLGVEINEVEALKYPYGKSNFLRFFKSGWENRKGAEEVE